MSADRAEQASGAEPASAWAPGGNETQSSPAGASSHVAAEHWESRAGHPSEALARQGPRLGWGLDRRVMKTLLTRWRGRGAPGWVRGWPWGALLTSRPEGRSRAKRTKRGRGLATPRDPMGSGPESPPFHCPPTPVPPPNPARTGRHGACEVVGVDPPVVPWGAEDADRRKVPALPGAGLR